MSSAPHAEHVPPFSVSPSASAQLEASLEQAVKRRLESMAHLRDAVDACVTDLHRLGMTPEAVLLTMKALLRHTAAAHPPPGYSASPAAADAFVEQVVRWTIDAYFRVAAPPS